MKCGISFVCMEGTQANLEKEISDWDSNCVCNANRDLWNDALSKVLVKGGECEYTVGFSQWKETWPSVDIAR